MIPIHIPLKHDASKIDNQELRWMLRSLDKYGYEGDPVLFTDKAPEWYNGQCVIVERCYPKSDMPIKHYENFYDTLNKLYAMCFYGKDFLYAYDDNILLRPILQEEITSVVALRKKHNKKPQTKWDRTIKKALELTGGEYIYETHIPRFFEHDLLTSMFNNLPYDSYRPPYAPSTAYFNLCFDPDIILAEKDDIRARFLLETDVETREKIREEISGKLWMCYNNVTLFESGNDFLINWISENFKLKSKYEK